MRIFSDLTYLFLSTYEYHWVNTLPINQLGESIIIKKKKNDLKT